MSNFAKENIDALQKGQQISNAQANFNEKLAFDKQKHKDNTNLAKDQLASKTAIEQKKLAVAIVNQNSKDDKKLNKKVAKSQGVTK